MTQTRDKLFQGNAYFEKADAWNTTSPLNGMPVGSSPYDTTDRGVPHTNTFYYQIGQASTAGSATASRFFYSASGATGGISLTSSNAGAGVSGGVGTNDVPRGIRIFSSVNLSTVTFTIVGTDGYGQAQTHSFVGPSGNTLGNVGSYTDSLVTFKTVTSASGNASTGTTAFGISNNDMYGLPYVLANTGMAMGVYINGAMASIAPTFVAAFTPTGTPTASTSDVRGSVTLATAVLANDSRYITVGMIQNAENVTFNTDSKVNSYGAAPFSG